MSILDKYIAATTGNNRAVGGVPIGSAGSSGIYSTYSLAWGDDFIGPLNVVNVGEPYAPYYTNKYWKAGSRCSNGFDTLFNQVTADPWFTGIQDNNRGLAVGSANLWTANSVLNMRARAANFAEIPLFAGRQYISGLIHTAAGAQAIAPCIVEAMIRFPYGNSGNQPSGSHPSGLWTLTASPAIQNVTGGAGSMSFVFESNNTFGTSTAPAPTGFVCNYNQIGTVPGGIGNKQSGAYNLYDGKWHLLSLVMTAAGETFYVDGVSVGTIAQDATALACPHLLLSTNLIWNPATPSDWNNLELIMNLDYLRIWVPTSGYPGNVLTPLIELPYLQVAYNTSMTYNFPSQASLWGAGFSGTDYMQSIILEDWEPGASTEGSGYYQQFPAGLTLSSRQLTGITSDKKPGRMHTTCTAYAAGGGVTIPARGAIDVGPQVTTTTINCAAGKAGSYDVYFDCDCGDLVPKSITVTGLPTGASFDPVANLINWTSSIASGTTAITINVTNAVGQTANKTVNLVAASTVIPALDSPQTKGTDATGSSITINQTTKFANEVIIIGVALVSASGGTPASVSGITDTAGLSWTKRTSIAWGLLGLNSLELWYAISPKALYQDIITVNFTGATTYTNNTQITGVTLINQTTPFDPNASLPAQSQAVDATQSIAETISTTHATDMLLALFATTGNYGTLTKPTGFTQWSSTSATDAQFTNKEVSSTQSGVTETYSWTGTTSARALIVDALQSI